MASRAPAISSEKQSIHYVTLSAMFNLLHSIMNQELFEKHLCNPRIPHQMKEMVPRALATNYCLKSEVSITLCCQLCLTCCTAVRIKNYTKSISTIKVLKVATMKNTDDFCYEGNPNRHFLLSAKMNGTQRMTLVSP